MKLRKTRKCNCRMLPLFSFVFNSNIPSLVSLLLAKNPLEHAALRGPQARVKKDFFFLRTSLEL